MSLFTQSSSRSYPEGTWDDEDCINATRTLQKRTKRAQTCPLTPRLSFALLCPRALGSAVGGRARSKLPPSEEAASPCFQLWESFYTLSTFFHPQEKKSLKKKEKWAKPPHLPAPRAPGPRAQRWRIQCCVSPVKSSPFPLGVRAASHTRVRTVLASTVNLLRGCSTAARTTQTTRAGPCPATWCPTPIPFLLSRLQAHSRISILISAHRTPWADHSLTKPSCATTQLSDCSFTSKSVQLPTFSQPCHKESLQRAQGSPRLLLFRLPSTHSCSTGDTPQSHPEQREKDPKLNKEKTKKTKQKPP